MRRHYFVPHPAFAGHVYTWLRDFEGLFHWVIKFVRYCRGSNRLGRRVDDEKGIVAEIPECFCQKAKVAVPEKLVGADGEVGVEKNFQAGSFGRRAK
jgi:hypothetical protein